MFVAPRKEIRLSRDQYVGRKTYFVTICCEDRRPIFQDANRSRIAIEALKRVSESMQFFVYAFCIMPNHVHLIVKGKIATSNLVKFVAQWKQLTGYLFRRELPPRFWQRRFYDYVLREAEDCDSVAWYIWMNPVREGMAAEPHLYLFSGSFTVEWPKVSPPRTGWVPPWKNHGDPTL